MLKCSTPSHLLIAAVRHWLDAFHREPGNPTHFCKSWLKASGGAILGLGLSLGGAIGGWIVQEAIAPQVVHAYEARLNLTVTQEDGESYQNLIKRAEAIVRAGIQRSFDTDILITDVFVYVSAQSQGQEAPLLSLSVSRVEWRNHPDPGQWITYFPGTQELLGLDFGFPTAPRADNGSATEPVLGTGDVQVTLRWATIDDLDLAVVDPAGQTVSYQNTRIASGGTLDVDANAGCADETTSAVENVFWPTGGAPSGDYVAEVNLFTRCNNFTEPIPFSISILVQGEVETLTGTVDDLGVLVRFPFTVP